MRQECVVGVYDSPAKAEQAVHILRRAGFPAEHVSVVAPGSTTDRDLVDQLKMGDDSVRDGFIGAGLGGLLGALAGLGFLTLTGPGLVFVIGPIAMGMTGSTVGAFVGTLVGWGVHNSHLEHYEDCLQAGKSLLIAHGDALELAHTERVLLETDAAEVRVHARAGDDAPEILDTPVAPTRLEIEANQTAADSRHTASEKRQTIAQGD